METTNRVNHNFAEEDVICNLLKECGVDSTPDDFHSVKTSKTPMPYSVAPTPAPMTNNRHSAMTRNTSVLNMNQSRPQTSFTSLSRAPPQTISRPPTSLAKLGRSLSKRLSKWPSVLKFGRRPRQSLSSFKPSASASSFSHSSLNLATKRQDSLDMNETKAKQEAQTLLENEKLKLWLVQYKKRHQEFENNKYQVLKQALCEADVNFEKLVDANNGINSDAVSVMTSATTKSKYPRGNVIADPEEYIRNLCHISAGNVELAVTIHLRQSYGVQNPTGGSRKFRFRF